MSDFFQRGRAAVDGANADRQFAFQEKIVKSLLTRAGITIPVAAAKREAAEAHGRDTLDFDWLEATYPTFPVRMLSAKLRYTETATISSLYGKGNFKKLPWYREYISQVDLHNIDLKSQRAAFVFNLPYAQDAYLMVLHNQPVQAQIIRDAELRQDEPWPRTTFPMKSHGVVCVLEALDSFMQTVGTDWVHTL